MSIKVNIYNKKGEQTGDVKLSDNIFGVEVNEVLVHQAMLAQMGNKRQVLAHTKDRSEVRGGGKKPWRQKGTGRARAGSSRSPIWIGGGVTFGPTKDRNFKKNINKKMRLKAMFMALSDKVTSNSLFIIDNIEAKEYKTKVFDELVTNLEKKAINSEKKKDEISKKRSILVINNKKDEKIKYSARNLTGIKLININNINLLDLLKYQNLVLTKETVKIIEEAYKVEVKK